MSAPRIVPPAPAPAPLPLPNPQNAPTQKKYSEGSMYEDLSPEDVEAWHRRYSEFKKWRQEIPNKGVVGDGSAMSPGQGVGVGSADWTWREPSDNGTIPSTVVERAWEKARARSNMGPQAEPPAPSPPKTHLSKRSSKRNLDLQARVETLDGSETPPSQPASRATTIRPPLSQKPIPSHNTTNTQISQKSLKTPTIEIQPPSTKTPNQVPPPSSKPARYLSQRPPTSSVKPTRPPPTPLLAQPPTAEHTAKPSSEPKIMSHSPSTRGSLVPGEQVVPSPTPSAKYAEREAYIASALSLPLDMLVETEEPPRVDSSSHFTTGRLNSLLGKSRSGSRTKRSQRSAGSSTTLPSVRSDQVAEKKPIHQDLSQSQLARSKTTSAVPARSRASERTLTDHREHHYEGSNHLPVPGASLTKAKAPSDATVLRAANQPLPPSTNAPTQASTKPPAKSSHTQATDTRSARPSTRPADSDATVIRASREPLPLSVATSAAHAETIKIPASVKTIMASSGPATRAPPSEATVIRAAQVPLPTGTGRTGTVRTSPSTVKQQEPLSPRNVPLPPTAVTAASTVVSRKEPAHRQQMPLPRPALTPQPSFDGLTKATSLGRKHRDPSLGDLTAHFEPSMYPLPPSGATLFSSPEQVGFLPPRTVDEHAVAFSTVEYIPPESLKSTTQASTPAPQPSVRTRSNKSVPLTPGARAAAIPLPPSTAVLSSKSTPKAIPPAPAPCAASPPAPPPPPVTTPVELSGTNAVPIPTAEPVSRPSSHRLSNLPVDPTSFTQSSSEPRSPTHTHPHPHIHLSPGQVSQSLRSEDDHVSFEVPSGSRGRLRVTLKWFREGGRSERSSPRAGRLSVVEEDAPPPVPPKTTSLMGKVMGKSRDRPRTEDPPRSTHEEHRRSHPIPEEERPELSPPPPKRDNLKSPSSDDQFPPNQQAQQQHHPSGPAPYYNPYYSGATLPAYAAAMPQVYNMFSPPLAYPQPGLPAWAGPGGYRPHPQPQMGPPQVDPTSPARESVDPPSDMEPPPQPAPPAQSQPLHGYPPQMMGMGGYPQQGYWNGMGMARPSIWQRMFRRPSQGQGQGQEDNLGPDDSVTIRNWAKGVQPGGKAPTMLPTPQRGIPMIVPNQQQQNPRPTLANTAYPGMGMTNTPNGPGTTLYNARGGYPMRREGTPSVWEKLMYRRQTEEAVYRSPPRRGNRGLPDPAPSPSPLGRHQRRNIFSRSREVSRNKPPNGVDGRRKEREDRYAARQREKEERRRQRSLRRDQRANANAANQGLRNEQFLDADSRDRPGDLAVRAGGQGRGRSGTLVGEWVGRFGMGRSRGQFPNSESQVRNYQQPRLWKDRLGLNNRTQRNTTTTPGITPTRAPVQGQAQGFNGRGQRATLRRTLRTTEKIVPGTTGGNALGLGLGSTRSQAQGQGMRGMIGRFGMGSGNRRDDGRGRRRTM